MPVQITPIYIEYSGDDCSWDCPFYEGIKNINTGSFNIHCHLFNKDLPGYQRCFECFKVVDKVEQVIEKNNPAWANAYNRVKMVVENLIHNISKEN